MAMKAGRKPLFDCDGLKIGESIRLPKNKEAFKHQYASNFRKRLPGRDFKAETDEKGKVFIKRIR